jgi:hypothetical protein
MRIVMAGGHGRIARLLAPLLARRLAEAGHQPIGPIRNLKHADDLLAAGACGETAIDHRTGARLTTSPQGRRG